MGTVSLPAKPGPFVCNICQSDNWTNKAGASCQQCPAYSNAHYHPYGDGNEACDVLFLGDSPSVPKLSLIGLKKPEEGRYEGAYHLAFQDDAGRVIRGAVKEVQSRSEFQGVSTRFIYAVKCSAENPNRDTISSCQTPLKNDLLKIAGARRAARKDRPLVVVACGTNALTALGITGMSEQGAQGRVFDCDFAGLTLKVVFTRSLKAIAAATGKYSSLIADVDRAFRIATDREIKPQTREEIEQYYIYPKTIAEVKDLVQMVHEYSENGVPHLDWSIACDTETNSLHPNWDGFQCTVFSLAWSTGRAAAIPLWHKETNYDPKEAWEQVRWLLASGKPTIWHNAKYDYKVLWKLGWPFGNGGNTAWDVMLAEHVLEEDKKGQYSLKYLTKQFLPHYSGYEDKLHEFLDKEDKATETLEVMEQKAAGKILKAPPVVMEALALLMNEKIVKSERFNPKALTKRIQEGEFKDRPELLKALAIVISAKMNGEFRAAKVENESKKARDLKGGFENVPLSELLFYAAVDTDATRQLAVMQVQRMRAEDELFEKYRKHMRSQQAWSRDPKTKHFKVLTLCTTPDPLRRMAKFDYVPRQRELAKIEYKGININQDYLAWGEKSLASTVTQSELQIYEMCGDTFKLGSSKKLGSFLFDTGIGYKHPDPEVAQQLAIDYPDEVKYSHGRIMYRAHHYTGKGAEQTNEQVLKSLVTRFQCPLSNLILSHKKAEKGKNSFFVNIGKLSQMFGDGMIHPGYNLTGTATGRLSSSSGVPKVGFNNQNIPKGLIGALRDIRGNLVLDAHGRVVFEGVKCKKLFIPDDSSMCFGNADAKGAEVAVFSAYANDTALIQALIEGMDAHCFFASEALSPDMVGRDEYGNVLTGEARRIALTNAAIDDDHPWTYEDFKNRDDIRAKGVGSGDPKIKSTWEFPDLVSYADRLNKIRDNIKRLVFGMLYGAGIKKISEIAGISHALGKKIQDLLFSKFPSIRLFMEQTKWELRTFGFVETFEGRRRRFAIKNAPSGLLGQAERRALNFKVQGQNSDIVMKVLCWVAEVLERDMGGRLLLTVHDSIGFQVPKKYAHQMPELFKELGTNRVARECPWMPVPYRWDLEMGPSYGETMNAAKYIQSVPQSSESAIIMPPQLSLVEAPDFDGYTEEERIDDLRDPDEIDLPRRKKPNASA